jgi:hypothetical protein
MLRLYLFIRGRILKVSVTFLVTGFRRLPFCLLEAESAVRISAGSKLKPVFFMMSGTLIIDVC